MDARTSVDEPDSDEMTRLLKRIMIGVNAQAFRMFGSNVKSGPFAGMEVPVNTPWDDGNCGVKMMGCYEAELEPSLRHAAWRKPKAIVNVGCSEGYYAIGLAKMFPDLDVYAFDTCVESLHVCEDYAERNGVKLTTAEGCRSAEELRLPGVSAPRLYIVDAEGDEKTLIDLDACPELITSDLIIECHDFMVEGISTTIADRLSHTHQIDLIRPKAPDLTKFEFLHNYPTLMSMLLVIEKRPMPCYWLACWARSRR